MRTVRGLLVAALLTLASASVVSCGGNGESREAAVAVAEKPPPLPAHTAASGSDPADGAGQAVTATPGEQRAASTAILSSADKAGFERLAASLGVSGLAVSGVGRGQKVEQAGQLRHGVAWSTAKVPIAMAVIAAGGSQAHAQDLTQAITASDNAAAMRLWAALGGGATAAAAADAQLRGAGDRVTRIQSRALAGPQFTPFGQTDWSLANQTRFTAGLSCSDAGRQVLSLMGQVVPGQRWGLGRAGAGAAFKGGWGPGSDPGASGGYLDRQMGVINVGRRPVAVAIATRPGDGSHASGTRNLTAITRWLRTHANARNLPSRPRC